MVDGRSTLPQYRLIEFEPNSKHPSNQHFPSNKIRSSKYTIWNFIPMNLFEQFRRVGNFYFLVSSIISTFIKSPISPLTSWLPLLFVISITACKQGYEDFKRYRSDRRVNNLPVTVVRQSGVQDIRCKEIKVGDIIRVNRDDEVPCDLVILHSSESSGKCYVTTSNLDGETNLKTLQVPKIFADFDGVQDIFSVRGTITCQHPVPGLYQFEGRVQATMTLEDNETINRNGALTIDNLMLRGSRLKDTDYVVGCAVYTGRDTKLSLNSMLKLRKTSVVDKSINRYLVVFIILLLIEVTFCVIMNIKNVHNSWNVYLGSDEKYKVQEFIELFFSFIVILNYILPISLYVTLELQKFLGSYTFNWDLQMYDELTDQSALANTSDLNENLGQVEYLFSDKTGTLTENLMIFRRCFVNGYAYMEKDCDGNLYLLPPDGSEKYAEKINNWTREVWQFLMGISICHDVHIAPLSQKVKAKLLRTEYRESFRRKRCVRLNSSLMMDPDLPVYEAASVDEKALVEASARLGVIYQGNKYDNGIEINLKGSILRFYKLEILEFSSERKRMSVIVEDTDGDIWLYCKGADSSVFPLITDGDTYGARTYVTDFSMRGLRTLVYGYKKFPKNEYMRLSRVVNDARQIIGAERSKAVERAYAKMESNLTLLGVSALEDRLQESVPETMERLRAAGIKIWVLTGDKAETAENIAFFSGHFKKGTSVMRLMNLHSSQSCFITLTSFERKIKIEPCMQRGLLLDGTSMGIALKTCPALLRNVAMACEAVVCCRMSPLQKKQIVQMVKQAPGRPLTAAIGDGGNDVSMIKEADVGFGIMGKEGRQAAMNADYAFAKFMFLQRALLVHGHWYYLRASVLTMYFFYKNIVFTTPQLLFSFHSGFSSQALYDGVYLMTFNTFFSAVPIVIYGIFEKNYSDEKLLNTPHFYQLYRKNYLLSTGQFFLWMFVAIWQTVAIYFIPYLYWKYNQVVLYDNKEADLSCFSTLIMHLVILIVNFELLILSSYWTVPFVLSIVLTEFCFLTFAFGYSFLYISFDGNLLAVFPRLLRSPVFWLLTILIIGICLIPTILIGIYQNHRPARLRGKLTCREENISDIIYTPVPCPPTTLPNRHSSSTVPWRCNMSFDNVVI